MDSAQYLPQDDNPRKARTHPRPFEKSLSSEDWNQGNMATLVGVKASTDNEKINAMNTNNRHLDTEMADQSVNSRGLTPQSSNSYNQSSSNTSYSPSQHHDDDQSPSMTGGGGTFMAGFTTQPQNTSAQQPDDPFKLAAGWEMGTGMTPGSMTGMTPEGGWEKLMDSMGWETGRTG